MTIGEKLRKYRNLKGLTQKELGTKALKGKLNAGVRINQYEKDMAVPGDEIKNSLAEVLNIDIEALSDVNIRSDEDIMFVLFELEEKRGLKLTKEDGKIHLVFDAPDNDNNNEHLTTYLNFWGNEAFRERNTDEEKVDYENWKARFSTNIKEYLAEKETAINAFYSDKVKAYHKQKKYAKETPEICRLLKQIMDAGLSLSTKYGRNRSAGYSFDVNELLNPPSEEATDLFARFLSEWEHFKELGAECFTELSYSGDTLSITYYVANPELQIIKVQISEYINDLKNPNINKWSAEEKFEKNLKSYHNNIEDSIKFVAGQ